MGQLPRTQSEPGSGLHMNQVQTPALLELVVASDKCLTLFGLIPLSFQLGGWVIFKPGICHSVSPFLVPQSSVLLQPPLL